MPADTRPYVFYSYHLTEQDEELEPFDEFEVFNNLKGVWLPHRKPVPTEKDHDTALVELRETPSDENQADSHRIVFFSIVQKFRSRPGLIYDAETDQLKPITQPADSMRRGFVVAVPSHNLMAVRDSSSDEDINAQSTNARLKSVVRSIPKHRLATNLLASTDFVEKAMEKWTIDSFRFEVWPYNPHPRRGGEKLAALLKPENVRVNATVKSNKGESVNPKQNGIVSQAMALSSNGYGIYGGSGKTGDGYKSTVEKARPGEAGTIKLKIYIPIMAKIEDHVRAVAKTMLELNDD